MCYWQVWRWENKRHCWLHQWLSERLQYLRCVSNGDATVLHQAIALCLYLIDFIVPWYEYSVYEFFVNINADNHLCLMALSHCMRTIGVSLTHSGSMTNPCVISGLRCFKFKSNTDYFVEDDVFKNVIYAMIKWSSISIFFRYWHVISHIEFVQEWNIA